MTPPLLIETMSKFVYHYGTFLTFIQNLAFIINEYYIPIPKISLNSYKDIDYQMLFFRFFLWLPILYLWRMLSLFRISLLIPNKIVWTSNVQQNKRLYKFTVRYSWIRDTFKPVFHNILVYVISKTVWLPIQLLTLKAWIVVEIQRLYKIAEK